MTDLERRALLGDRQAQEECTEKGIMLPCPFCGGDAEKDYILGKIYFGSDDKPSNRYYTYCTGIECPTFGSYSRYYKTEREAVLAWNTRPAPPIGRCVECAHWYKKHCAHGPCATEPTDAYFFCGSFEPKGGARMDGEQQCK